LIDSKSVHSLPLIAKMYCVQVSLKKLNGTMVGGDTK